MKYVTNNPVLAGHYYACAIAALGWGSPIDATRIQLAAAAYQRSESYRRVWWYSPGPTREMDEAEFS